ncbi:MAG: hypothetical protein ACP5LW_00695, partial [Nitrososphaeria archaeon]
MRRAQGEIIGAVFLILLVVSALFVFYYVYTGFASLALLENQNLERQQIARASILIENYSVSTQSVQFNVTYTNSRSSWPYLHMLDGNSYATLNVSPAIVDIAVPIRAQNMVLNLYGYNNNQNVSYLFVYAMNSSGAYVLLGGYAVSPGPFQLNIPIPQTYVVNGAVQLRLSSYQLAAFATTHITGGINYVIVTIFNIANAPTPVPFQQEINLSITNPVAQLVNPSGSNIIFEYLNGTIIPSWFEGRDSHGDFIWWIKLGQSIPAGSTLL